VLLGWLTLNIHAQFLDKIHAHLELLVACGKLNRLDATVLQYNNVFK
jgi:hypothetical protein